MVPVSPFSADLTARLHQESIDNLVRDITQKLVIATILYRPEGGAASPDELRHAERWAKTAVSLMSQALMRQVGAAQKDRLERIVISVAKDTAAFDEDHSAADVVEQACDRMAHAILRYNLPLQMNLAIQDAVQA